MILGQTQYMSDAIITFVEAFFHFHWYQVMQYAISSLITTYLHAVLPHFGFRSSFLKIRIFSPYGFLCHIGLLF